MRLHFGEFCFDTDRRELLRGGSVVHLTPKAIDLLRLLIDERPRILRKEEIHLSLWPETYVEEANLSVHISEVRAALGDDSKEPRFIKTAHRYGYGFIGEIRRETAPSMVRLRVGKRDFDLLDGDNIVGRDTRLRRDFRNRRSDASTANRFPQWRLVVGCGNLERRHAADVWNRRCGSRLDTAGFV